MIGENRRHPRPSEEIRERILGEYGEHKTGHLLILIGGLHGNEHGGIIAIERVLARLHAERPVVRGRLVALAGNLAALRAGERYIHVDLNRMWSPEQIDEVGGLRVDEDVVESQEQTELVEAINAQLQGAWRTVSLIDLHSTSADAAPFCIIGDTLRNRDVAFDLHIPVILGLEEAIGGTIQEYFGERGFVTAAIEGGRHDAAETADRLESALWLTLVSTGLLARRDVRDIDTHERRLKLATRRLPRVVEVFHRHGREPGDEFAMLPGFENFSPVKAGQLVATDRRGGIRAHRKAMLILPSYQGLGDDGFFLGRHVNEFWLRLSLVARRLRLDRLVPLLPGVRRDPFDARKVLVDPRVARYLVLKIFHLLGFRKCPPEEGRLVFRRRHEQWMT